jgi:hypothetical protein
VASVRDDGRENSGIRQERSAVGGRGGSVLARHNETGRAAATESFEVGHWPHALQHGQYRM